MIKLFVGAIGTIICAAIALIPESIMYLIWNSLDPVTFIQKVLLLGLFWFGGLSLCILFFVIAVMLWVGMITLLAEL